MVLGVVSCGECEDDDGCDESDDAKYEDQVEQRAVSARVRRFDLLLINNRWSPLTRYIHTHTGTADLAPVICMRMHTWGQLYVLGKYEWLSDSQVAHPRAYSNTR